MTETLCEIFRGSQEEACWKADGKDGICMSAFFFHSLTNMWLAWAGNQRGTECATNLFDEDTCKGKASNETVQT